MPELSHGRALDEQVQLVYVEDQVIVINFCRVLLLEDDAVNSECCQWKSHVVNFNTQSSDLLPLTQILL